MQIIMFVWADSKTRYFYAYLMYAWGEQTDPNCPTKDTHGGCTYISSKKYDASAIAIVYIDDTMHVGQEIDFDGISGCSSSTHPCELITMVVPNKSTEHHRWVDH